MDRPTREQILQEPAGPRLDAWVAAFVMGDTVLWDQEHGICATEHGLSFFRSREPLIGLGRRQSGAEMVRLCPGYSTDIAAAWQVLEKFASQGYNIDVSFNENFHPGSKWRCYWLPIGQTDGVDGETAPHAICRMALLAALSVQ